MSRFFFKKYSTKSLLKILFNFLIENNNYGSINLIFKLFKYVNQNEIITMKYMKIIKSKKYMYTAWLIGLCILLIHKYPNTGVILLTVKVFVANSSILSLKMAT